MQLDKKRYIELIKDVYKKIEDQVNKKSFLLDEINRKIYELDPEIIYIEQDEYNHLRYLIDMRLNDYEKEIIYMTFGFYGKCYSASLIASKLKVPTGFINHSRKEIILKLKKWLVDEDIVKKSSK